MHIQWFPGHMTKSLRMIKQNLPLVDAVIYVLDSRAPQSSVNPAFDELIGSRKVLYVLNKADLADPAITPLWVKHFSGGGCLALAADGTKSGTLPAITGALTRLMQDKIAALRLKGVTLPLRVMVLGIPNSGKSTIINTLCKSKRARTGNKPGVTRGKQWVKVGGFEILDTPGTLWNAFESQQAARRLAYIGSINDDILDTEELAVCFLQEVLPLYKREFAARYKMTDLSLSPLELLREAGRVRGFLLKGDTDMQRTANAVLDDFRKGRIGRITLERPGTERLVIRGSD